MPLPPHLRTSVDVPQPLLPWDRPQAAAAVAFAIVTEGSHWEVKVRRGEDWRRSFHNATTQTRGGPRHHTVDDMILTARRLHHAGHRDRQIWVQRPRSRVWTTPRRGPGVLISFTEYGPTLWQNHVHSFGATGSVWGYGWFADFLMHVGRLSLLCDLPLC